MFSVVRLKLIPQPISLCAGQCACQLVPSFGSVPQMNAVQLCCATHLAPATVCDLFIAFMHSICYGMNHAAPDAPVKFAARFSSSTRRALRKKAPAKRRPSAKLCRGNRLSLLAERKGGLVGNDNAVGVQLQDRSRARGRNRTIAHVMHGLSLGLAVGDD